MPGTPARKSKSLSSYWLQRRCAAVGPVGCGLFVFLATSFAGALANGNLIWVANGVLLAYLLLAPRRRWPAYLIAAFLGHVLGAAAIHTPWQIHLIDTPLDLGEALLGALLLRRRSAQLPQFTSGAYLLRFVAFAALASPLASGLLHALLHAFWLHAAFTPALLQWAAADSLGACVVTPACVAIFRARRRDFVPPRRNWPHLLLLTLVAFAVLSQSKAPLPFLLYPLLTLILLRVGLGWAAMSTLYVAAIGSWFTVHGQGPFASSHALSPLEPSVVFQLFVVSALFMLHSISVVLENQRAAERSLKEIVAVHKVVTENSRDVIIIADFQGNRSFVSAAGSNWGGWSQQEMLRLRNFDLIHPEDRPMVAATNRELRAGKDGALVECRVQTHSGDYVWVEANLRTLRDPVTGAPAKILNIVRDITERKLAQQRLQEAYHALEAMAVTDALTGLANRRRFDQCLAAEWRRGLRDRKPLSLVLIDADLFKSYNDTYGHLRGDNCLKQIAEAALDVVARPGDLVARFGGEEFAAILPNTAANGAFQVAQDICAAMRNRQLPHSANPAGIVTLSIGCATLIPQLGQNAAHLIDSADHALYQAKRDGRNCARSCRQDEGAATAIDECGSALAVKTA